VLISLNWIKEYINLDDISTEEIVDKLTYCGLEVDEVIDKGKDLKDFVVGFVKECGKHPNADKLSKCVVFDGEKDWSVVCGANNVAKGQKIIFAPTGTYIPGADFTLKKTNIRGEVSEGMICSEKELLLGNDHNGIMVLDEALIEGTPIAVALNVDDVQLEIAITPDRADALSHYGIARELAALFDRDVKKPVVKLSESDQDIKDLASVEVENVEDCPRYSAKVVTDVTIQESPEWLKKTLNSIGLRPINNVVDVTNFVLHELGQPLHAFDLDRLSGKKIIVKSAGEDQKFTTLDSKIQNVKAEDLFICDGDKPVALAGVMGGENSEVIDSTTNILIESAYFRPSRIRRTAKLVGISSDASYRFERGCNPAQTVFAAERAAQLIAELGGGKIAKGTIDVYPNKIEPLIVELRYERIEKILGYNVPLDSVILILNKLDLKVLKEDFGVLTVSVPPLRPDIEREIDLIEEVARIYGYDKIPEVTRVNVTLEKKTDQSEFVANAKKTLIGMGFNEIITNSLMTDEVAGKFGKSIPVLNPSSTSMSHLRTSLIPGALSTIAKNINVRENNLMLFEVGKTFNKISEGKIEDFSDFVEKEELTLVITGNNTNAEWYEKERKNDVYDLKGFVDEFLNKMSLDYMLQDSKNVKDSSIYSVCYSKIFKKEEYAVGGKINYKILKSFDIGQDVFVFTLNITELKKLRRKTVKFNELLKYPKMVRDAAFILDKNILNSDIELVIRKACSKLLKNIKLFDIFESDSLGEGKKSMAYQLEFYDESRTLTEEEVDSDFWKAIESVKSKFSAQLRGH